MILLSFTHILFRAFFACDQIDQIVVATCSFRWHCVGPFCDTTSDSACNVQFLDSLGRNFASTSAWVWDFARNLWQSFLFILFGFWPQPIYLWGSRGVYMPQLCWDCVKCQTSGLVQYGPVFFYRSNDIRDAMSWPRQGPLGLVWGLDLFRSNRIFLSNVLALSRASSSRGCGYPLSA